MQLTTAIQEALLALLALDETPGGAKLVSAVVPLRAYDTHYYDVAKACDEYLDRYDKPVGEHLLDIIERLCEEQPDLASVYKRIYQSLGATYATINREYVLDKARAFARFQNMRRSIGLALTELEKETEDGIDQAEAALLRGMDRSQDLFDGGTFLTDKARSLAFLHEDRTAFSTGIPQIDRYGLGPARKRLHTFIALPGRGKSWWLVHLAKQALLGNLKVLFLSFELDEMAVSQRIMQNLFAVPKRKSETLYERVKFEVDELGRFSELDIVEIPKRPSLEHPRIAEYLSKKIDKQLANRPQVLVREFAAGELSLRGLEAYLDAVEAHHSFIPDLLVVDYADEMRIPGEDHRLGLGAIYKGLRGIAQKRNIAVATATQAGRSAVHAKLITREHVAEDWSKIARADVVITYSQTQPEYELGLARLYVDKGRTDADRFTTLIAQSYATGQFCMDTAAMVSSYWDHVEEDDQYEEEDAG